MCHKNYIEKAPKCFGMQLSKTVSTPIAPHFRLSTTFCVPYASEVDSMIHVMICTCLDISHAANVVSRYVANHGKQNWQAINGFLIYQRYCRCWLGKYDKDFSQRNNIVGFMDFVYVIWIREITNKL